MRRHTPLHPFWVALQFSQSPHVRLVFLAWRLRRNRSWPPACLRRCLLWWWGSRAALQRRGVLARLALSSWRDDSQRRRAARAWRKAAVRRGFQNRGWPLLAAVWPRWRALAVRARRQRETRRLLLASYRCWSTVLAREWAPRRWAALDMVAAFRRGLRQRGQLPWAHRPQQRP